MAITENFGNWLMSIKVRFSISKDDFNLKANINIPWKGITALFGPSGSGKTTLLRAIAGLDYHADSLLNVGGKIWQDKNIFVPPHQRKLGYVFQEASLFPHLDVIGNLKYGAKRVRESDHKLSLDNVIELLGIAQLLKRKPNALSGGERQRVAIARALAVSPDLLLMDEPMASLDINRKKEMLPYLQSLQKSLDIPIIYVSHSTGEVAQLADHIVAIDNGNIIAVGDSHDVFTRLDLPLAKSDSATAIIDASVIGYDEQYHLMQLKFSGGELMMTGDKLAKGSSVRLRIAARDVSLTLKQQKDSSILKQFAGCY